MSFDKVVIIGGGVLGTQIGLMSAYTGHDTTFWLRSESSIGRTQPKIEQYGKAMMQDLEDAKKLIGNPMGGFLYPHGMIRDWSEATAESIDALLEQGKKNMEDLVHIELDLAKAMENADIIIVLEDGEVAGIGTHKELQETCEVYKEICQSQVSAEEVA